MGLFRAIVFAAALAGLLVGFATSLLQHLGTVPLIQQAETYEKTAPSVGADVGAGSHVHAADAQAHDDGGWEPADGFERNAYTLLFNVVGWIGFGLVTAATLVLLGRPAHWRDGFVVGLAGFAVFVLAPTIGLPPELPGVPAAALGPRQVWWVATAAATAAGLWLLVSRRSPVAAAAAIGLILLPHLVGAPMLQHAETRVPHDLSQRFAVAVLATSLVSWALLGGLTGYFYRRFGA